MILMVNSSYAQKLYLNFGLGYNYNSAPSFQLTENIDVYTLNGNTEIITGINNSLKETVSFGKGFQFGGTIGYLHSKNICFEVGINYLVGKEYEDKYTEKHQNYSNVYSQKYNSNMLRLSPTVRFSVGEKLSPYLKAGMVFSVSTNMNIQENFSFIDQNNKYVYQESEFEVSGGLSIGFIAGIGVCLETSKKTGMFAEINLISQSWAPEKLTYSKYIQNGKDVMSLVPKGLKEVEYVDFYSDNMSNPNLSTTSKQLKKYLPYSSIGFNIGIYFKL